MFNPEDIVELDISPEDLGAFPDLELSEEDLKDFPELDQITPHVIQEVLAEAEGTQKVGSPRPPSPELVDFEYLKKLDAEDLISSFDFDENNNYIDHLNLEDISDQEEEASPDLASPIASEEPTPHNQEGPILSQEPPSEPSTSESEFPDLECREVIWDLGPERKEDTSWSEVVSILEERVRQAQDSSLPTWLKLKHKRRNQRRYQNRKKKKQRTKLASFEETLSLAPWDIWAPRLKEQLERYPDTVALDFCEKLCLIMRNAPF